MFLRVTLALVLALALIPAAQAQPCMPQCVLAAGGSQMAGSGVSLLGTVGQTAVGAASGPLQTLFHGFWFCPLLFVSSTDGRDLALPAEFRLEPAYPNPCSHLTRLRFGLPEESHVVAKLFDLGGRQVATLLDQVMSPGVHAADLDASRLPAGVYYCRMQAGGRVQSARLVILK